MGEVVICCKNSSTSKAVLWNPLCMLMLMLSLFLICAIAFGAGAVYEDAACVVAVVV